MKKKVVVDVDAGTDDAVALLLLLTLEQEKDYDVVGITCVHGNTTVDNVCRNVLTILQCINRFDVPVFRGTEGPIVAVEKNEVFTYFHGKNGFGDKEFSLPKGNIQNENAVVALNRIAAENSGIALICLGPLTNVALALRTYPEFGKNLKEVYLMGGNVMGVGNTSPAAEFNFLKDPEAAHIVLSSLHCPVTVLPWETCLKLQISKEERFDNIGSISSPHIKLLNEIEHELYKTEESWIVCDAILAAAFLDEKIIKESQNVHLAVELHGMLTRGQGVIDHRKKKPANVTVIYEINSQVFKNLMYKMALFIPKN